LNRIRLPIYLDHHATTPLDGRVLDAMMPYLTERFGNASSLDHSYGHDALTAVQLSREKIAKAINAHADEIVFTSGATESDNIALTGTMLRYADRGNHLITCVTEHKAVLDTARHLESVGKRVTYLPVDRHGQIDLKDLRDAIADDTVMISIMAANNEIGTIQDLGKIGKIAHENDIIFHTDAAQAVGHITMDVKEMNIDLMSFSAHKMYGPKGIGALYVRRMKPRVQLEPIMHGGGQERGIRSGTLNVPAIVGFGRAVEIACAEMHDEAERLGRISQEMLESLFAIGAKLNGDPQRRLPYNINVRFAGVEGKAIINSISKDVAISAGSACTTQTVEPSHVLLAIGLDEKDAHESIRVGLGRFNTDEEADYFVRVVSNAVNNLAKIRA